ncbi:asparagine--tRNA ligase [Cytophaga hutchinsonii]|uniref:Asparagine--tRNA ligase n=1 Tax=Cytophaga hutchinsonii (strain ATCC 33406 / DSM 1761 / CIP 103989 / NBRC 15051 / NCIMB 9469 / D465) TaxID=269798 RepID=SYN_CYTH3|nr:asparagine--tRNA ligase [Cytophaga hutchinsonii]Q11Q97.1 RecName: Full=Asparagine--tRNA ligase; AltName: Full=Asparaginyl-tRNA synthetase; Short=AsnRS [Cytophaga hutchinsonii ATCC 33406]ABG60416.1 asparagine--tRNA ligase [Cytophaga hutchinsonii ATCC 33406]SFX86422.1 asparaginyl-tRNA synthetase [Cytophaga hutchinsonii ATCC 33406]
MKRIKIKELLSNSSQYIDQQVVLKGWVRTKRGNKHVAFVALNDGSTIHTIQIVLDVAKFNEEQLKDVTTGACISISGKVVTSQGAGQSIEVQGDTLEVIGVADPETYPLQKKGHSLEFLREIAHLRPRTNTFSCVLRLRHAMAFAVHSFFNEKGFVYVHTPIITGSDAEGAGAMFQVTTLDLKNPSKTKEGEVDFTKDFFGKATNLTVSGQLEGELAAMALGEVYTFGPTFRAENSNTTRHLAEFWMIEPEMAFYEIQDNMDLAEEFLKYLVKYALDNCIDDLNFLNEMYDKELIERLKSVVETPFVRLNYTEAVDILIATKQKFEYKVEWGIDLQSEHERYLVEKHFKKPVILTNYPKAIKAFYMKANEDGKTVRAMDVLFPGIGEIIGGSQREDNLEKLQERCKEVGIHENDIWWYLETRKFGSAPHSGFGLGFERLMLFVTGMGNIRDVIPFPRTPQSAEF